MASASDPFALDAPERRGRPRWIVCIDALSVAAFCVAWTAVAARLPELPAGAGPWLVAAGGLIGYALADLASGVVHWLADRHFDPETPILGSLLIAPFREHHRAPDAITQHGFLEVTGNNALVTLPLALALLVHPAPAGSHAWLLVHLTLIALAASVFATNPIHRWAHLETPPGWVRLLHRGGLVLTPEAHAEHHGPRHDRAYCVTSGWLNPLLDRVGFFRALDRAVERAASLRTLRRSGAP